MALREDSGPGKLSAIWPSSSAHRCLYWRTCNRTYGLSCWSEVPLLSTYSNLNLQQNKDQMPQCSG
jgi:hypothetical protein